MTRLTLAGLHLAAAIALSVIVTGAAKAEMAPLPILSRHALVVDEISGKPLIEKDVKSVVPIASLTKLMTAMVVLDAKQDMDEDLSIEHADVDRIKKSGSRMPVGATLPRRTLLHLTLMSSENRAASSLARSYPGGMPAFRAAVSSKLKDLGMSQTVIREPTGLSPHNTSTATDLIKMAKAAAAYPEISQLSTDTGVTVDINGRTLAYRNSNSFVGKNGWDILLSKTGYTKEAGRCIIMRLEEAGRSALVVLLNANGPQARAADIANIRRFLIHGDTPLLRSKGFVTIKPVAKTRMSAKAKHANKVKYSAKSRFNPKQHRHPNKAKKAMRRHSRST